MALRRTTQTFIGRRHLTGAEISKHSLGESDIYERKGAEMKQTKDIDIISIRIRDKQNFFATKEALTTAFPQIVGNIFDFSEHEIQIVIPDDGLGITIDELQEALNGEADFHFVSVSYNPNDDRYAGLFIADGEEVGDWQF